MDGFVNEPEKHGRNKAMTTDPASLAQAIARHFFSVNG
jgi:hypothetical protein